MQRKAAVLWALFGLATLAAVLTVGGLLFLLVGPYGPPAPWKPTRLAEAIPSTRPPAPPTPSRPAGISTPATVARTPAPSALPTPTEGSSAAPTQPPSPTPSVETTASPTTAPLPPPTGTPPAGEEPGAETARRLALAKMPPRDPVEIAGRLLLGGQTPPRTATPDPRPYFVGREDRFWLDDPDAGTQRQITATLEVISEHLYMYVEKGAVADRRALQAAAEAFEQAIYPAVRGVFGSEWNPGVDGDPHIVILHARFAEASGYFSSLNEVPRQVNPTSNQREMFYMNLDAFDIGDDGYLSTLAHEFLHMIHWHRDPGSDSWVAEGLAQTAEQIAGYDPSDIAWYFLDDPDLPLTTWSDDPDVNLAHYAASYLWFRYLAHRAGGPSVLADMLAPELDDRQAIERILSAAGYQPALAAPRLFDAFFADWTVANYLNDPHVADGRYAYDSDLDLDYIWPETVHHLPWEVLTHVHPYAADYFEVASWQEGDLHIEFDGEETLPLLDTTAHSGRHFWWSNRGDQANTHLTRRFDLRGQQRATLRYWLWYDIEPDYDYAYVEVSTDGGISWKTLSTPRTTDSNPNGNNYGHGYTGFSGNGRPEWVQEEIDLSPFAGREILLRFEMLTDDAYNATGLALDDVEIPEIGFYDDMESDAGWEASGFVWVDNTVPVHFLVQVISEDANRTITVQPVVLDAGRRGEIVLPGYGRQIVGLVVVVAAVAPATTEPAGYYLAFRLE